VFNILGVLGATAIVTPLTATDVGLMDGAILIATSFVGLVLIARPAGIGRLQGVILVGTYSLYLISALL
jgi:cation:H+ antiporter